MISVQILTRNLRRIASLRGLCSATFSKKEIIDETKKTKKTNQESRSGKSKSVDLFEKLKTADLQVKPAKSSVNSATPKTGQKRSLISRILLAKNVTELLKLSEQDLNQHNAMSILGRLSTLTASNQANVIDFENDYRFINVCRLLSKTTMLPESKSPQAVTQHKSTELEMVLSIAGDDEASKIIETLSLSQKVKVFSTLARSKTRSIQVLNTLAVTIHAHTDTLNLKQCSDLLFALNSLNYVDEMLLSRIAVDINVELPKNQDKTAVVGSIVTSLGFLKFKESTLLDNLTNWIIAKKEFFRPKDLASLVLTLALVNHVPKNVDDLQSHVISKICRDDLSAIEWLDFVWALSVLGFQQSLHFDSVLRPEFEKILSEEQAISDVLPAQKMKLLNINAVAKQLTSDYSGPFLTDDSSINRCPMGYRKSKKVLIQGLLDTMKNLFNENSFIRTENYTKFGFVIDVECAFNENRIPIAVESANKDSFRVAIMVLDYHDMCKGCKNEPNGYNALALKLLQKSDSHVLSIPHNEFSTSDKVLKRVQYLDSKLKEIFNESSKKI